MSPQRQEGLRDRDNHPPPSRVPRRRTRAVKAGKVLIGGGFPLSIQTMWKEPLSRDALPGIREGLKSLARQGCDIIRFAVPDLESADVLGALSQSSPLPVVADIHFDYRIALRCMEYPVAKIRINPGTIGEEWKVREVVAKARDAGVSIRVGINAGSLPHELENEKDVARAMIEAAEMELNLLEQLGFHEAVFSLKSSDVDATIDANTRFSEKYDYPLHIGVTEAGPLAQGIVRNSIGVSALLNQGIGDTIRVSLSAAPMQEILTGVEILRTLRHRQGGTSIISCPTCGRTTFDVKVFLEQVSNIIHNDGKTLTVAIMGCPVNGPGEARHADLGITGSGKMALIFKKGEIVRRVKYEEAVSAFEEEYNLACQEE
jgi:(E)-4-hydroxy-3-methylbut-2-enyl-diphosphate synthase